MGGYAVKKTKVGKTRSRRGRAGIPAPLPAALPAVTSMPSSDPTPTYRIERWSNALSPNPAMMRDVMARDGYSVYQWSDPAGTNYGMHKHETAQSHWIVSGVLEITVEGRGTISLGAGDRDFMPANTYHSARVVGDGPVLYLVGEVLPQT